MSPVDTYSLGSLVSMVDEPRSMLFGIVEDKKNKLEKKFK